MRIISFQLVTMFIVLVLSMASCLDDEDVEDRKTLFALGEGLRTIDCNLEHGLTPELNIEIPFSVLVQDLTGVPIPDVLIIVSFRQFTCNGRNFDVYYDEVATDETGFASGFAPFTFEWDNDIGEWDIAISGLGTHLAGYTERFDIDKLSLFHVYSIARLED